MLRLAEKLKKANEIFHLAMTKINIATTGLEESMVKVKALPDKGDSISKFIVQEERELKKEVSGTKVMQIIK